MMMIRKGCEPVPEIVWKGKAIDQSRCRRRLQRFALVVVLETREGEWVDYWDRLVIKVSMRVALLGLECGKKTLSAVCLEVVVVVVET